MFQLICYLIVAVSNHLKLWLRASSRFTTIVMYKLGEKQKTQLKYRKGSKTNANKNIGSFMIGVVPIILIL